MFWENPVTTKRQEICEFRKLLYHLNTRISLPVASLTVLNLSYTVSSVVHLFRDMTACPINIFTASLANILLWLFISLMPFFQVRTASIAAPPFQKPVCNPSDQPRDRARIRGLSLLVCGVA